MNQEGCQDVHALMVMRNKSTLVLLLQTLFPTESNSGVL